LNRLFEHVRTLLIFFAMASVTPAQTFKTIASFNETNGANPVGSLVQGADGNFYGTTAGGGTNFGGPGTVFKVSTGGALTTLHDFDYTDGAAPAAGLAMGTDGDFYGTTSVGSATNYGTVFKMTPTGVLTTLHSFCPAFNCSDGAQPNTALVLAKNGEFLGTTYVGGSATCRLTAAPGCGTVFQITPKGTLTTVYSFNYTDGAEPSGLVQAPDGNLYGTTANGTSSNCFPNGCGTVFKLAPGGTLTTLHNFDFGDGAFPQTPLQAPSGYLYGTTFLYGPGNFGTIFRITPSGALTTLVSWNGISGGEPSTLIMASDGNFYGTTEVGGTGSGMVFKMTPAGKVTTVYTAGVTDGFPVTGLTQGTDGNFYGLTPGGGLNNKGTVFVLLTGIAPFVKTVPPFGKVGAVIRILGSNLAGATAVIFNGAPAVFNVVRPSELTATVPAGATTGIVEVTIPNGKLSSDVKFRVLP
jgi:uncharacterized repeat protein (TIGR03803 family)